MPEVNFNSMSSSFFLSSLNVFSSVRVISKIFDSAKVAEEVIYYLVYHEMLHMLLPIKKMNGRRIVHAKKFKELEKQYPDYIKITKWIESNVMKLI